MSLENLVVISQEDRTTVATLLAVSPRFSCAQIEEAKDGAILLHFKDNSHPGIPPGAISNYIYYGTGLKFHTKVIRMQDPSSVIVRLEPFE